MAIFRLIDKSTFTQAVFVPLLYLYDLLLKSQDSVTHPALDLVNSTSMQVILLEVNRHAIFYKIHPQSGKKPDFLGPFESFFKTQHNAATLNMKSLMIRYCCGTRHSTLAEIITVPPFFRIREPTAIAIGMT